MAWASGRGATRKSACWQHGDTRNGRRQTSTSLSFPLSRTTASGELKDAPNYKYLVVNDQVETAAQEILTILAAEQIHQINKEEKVKEVLES